MSGRVTLLTGARTTLGGAVAAGLTAAGAQVRAVDPHPVSGLADAVAHCRVDDRVPHLLVHLVEVPTVGTGTADDRVLATARRVGRQVAAAAAGCGGGGGGGGGGVVFVAVPPAGAGPDAVTEAGLTALARTLATEFGPTGVRVNQVAGPGCADRPDQVTAAVLFLASDRAAGVTGQTLRLGGTP
ncbi:Rossmann fold domain-containing protein [Solwaraspora sp. WMMA2101]|uniref:Rossmann fold domain-containing protein n=1 Tax=Solwaraspora sp. WMMA2101 TaxID=3404124 RepID=UPI003B92A7D4